MADYTVPTGDRDRLSPEGCSRNRLTPSQFFPATMGL